MSCGHFMRENLRSAGRSGRLLAIRSVSGLRGSKRVTDNTELANMGTPSSALSTIRPELRLWHSKTMPQHLEMHVRAGQRSSIPRVGTADDLSRVSKHVPKRSNRVIFSALCA